MLTIKLCESEEELQTLAKLAEKIWNNYFLGIITQEQIDYMVAMNQSYPAIKKAIQEQHYRYYLAYEGDVMVGYMGVKPESERLFLSKLYLDAPARGKGYASLLFKQAVEYCKELGLKAIYLTCNKHNEHSLAVYRKKGFKVIDEAETDIGQGFIMDDYIMELTL
ncbi:GNAT family N-acetyltransferase [Dielma fastidiosa]|uniref:GNAT family N-acetyltransferase n=1 Tax=Dielma fastidiosa TaxID=1034346 RepID=UPI000E48430C|nr:GNAT family N-acetyltransferase [Dielma fastidiosa]RHN03070.1 GNAT family N-acetyltransferase [Dielma fastidiosa]